MKHIVELLLSMVLGAAMVTAAPTVLQAIDNGGGGTELPAPEVQGGPVIPRREAAPDVVSGPVLPAGVIEQRETDPGAGLPPTDGGARPEHEQQPTYCTTRVLVAIHAEARHGAGLELAYPAGVSLPVYGKSGDGQWWRVSPLDDEPRYVWGLDCLP